jgi:bifunctional UDP-N-acetylglucosamine pyrophosphorylase/glucosamine-1-phosphate N-acetyltransferase
MNKNISCIILAAGKGDRMKSQIPKVMHPICGRPMLGYVLDLVESLKLKPAISVLGYKSELVRKIIGPSVKIVIQKKLCGTADAIKTALPLLKSFKGTVLVLYGDNPLLRKETVELLLKYHLESLADATLLTAHMDKPHGYGRILRDKYGVICGIVEEKDADDFQKDIKEINTGIICFNKDKLSAALKYIRPDNRKKEYYLTDAIAIFHKKGYLVESIKVSDIQEGQGINSRRELSLANKVMHKRLNEDFMRKGVTIIDPDSVFISHGVKIGKDTTIYPFTVIERDVKIGKRCFIGPFAHLREGTSLQDDIVAGNFLEIVRARIGSQTLIKHFSYLGDSLIGKNVNIGAGTVTANFNGIKKNITRIQDGAFIGSDTVLVAPVVVGKKAVTGSGSVVPKNRNVPAGKVVAGVPAKALKQTR